MVDIDSTVDNRGQDLTPTVRPSTKDQVRRTVVGCCDVFSA